MKETRSRHASPAAVAAFALATAFGMFGCGDDGATPTDSGCAPGATASTGTGQSQPVPFNGDAPTCEVTDNTTAPAVCCPTTRSALPSFANSVLDFSDPATISEGTCGNYFGMLGERRAVLLSQDPADYPMKIVLPALSGPDPACLETCEIDVANPPYTAFGVAIATTAMDASNLLIGGNSGRVLAISVPPPWFIVSGGCGEACAWPCLEGYQEFGIRSCYTIAHGDFGFATADPNAPSVEAVVELFDLGGQNAFDVVPGGCCIYDAPPG